MCRWMLKGLQWKEKWRCFEALRLYRAHWPTLQSSMKAPFKTVRNRAALPLRSRNGPRGVRARRATVSRSAARCRRGAVVLGSWAKRWGTAMVVLELEGQLPSCRCFQNCWGFDKQMLFWQMQKWKNFLKSSLDLLPSRLGKRSIFSNWTWESMHFGAVQMDQMDQRGSKMTSTLAQPLGSRTMKT